MNITTSEFFRDRRLALKGAGVAALIGLGVIPFDVPQALAAANDKYPEEAFKQKNEADAIKALYGKTAEPSDKVKMDAPEIAEKARPGQFIQIYENDGTSEARIGGRVSPNFFLNSSIRRWRCSVSSCAISVNMRALSG